MKKTKVMFVVFALIYILCANLQFNSQAYAQDIDTEQKIYCEIDEDAEFSDDRIFVVLSNKASLTTKRYSVSDFPEISCSEVVDLTESLWQKVITHVHTMDCNPNLETKEEDFHRILKIVVSNPGKSNVIDSIRKLEKRDDIISAEPNYIAPISVAGTTEVWPTEFLNSEYLKWALLKIELTNAWSIETGSSDIMVGVIDTGIDRTHPDLINRVADVPLSRDFTGGDNPFSVTDYHGTGVAGVIGAQANNGGIVGVCWDVTLVSLKVMETSGEETADVIDRIVQALTHATLNDIFIVNMSIGGTYSTTTYDSAVKNFPGLIVCAAGNAREGDEEDDLNLDNHPHYPAAYQYKNVITVGATKYLVDEKRNDSYYGAKLVDIFAPGDKIASTASNGNYATWDKTSFATPFVTGVAALLLSHNPKMTAEEIKCVILYTCDEVAALQDKCVSGGRLNAYEALLHQHDFEYSPNGPAYHKAYCACGYSKNISHQFKNHTCLVCGYYKASHTYTFTYKWIDTKQHYAYCACGEKTIKPHVVSSVSLSTNASYTLCISCKGRVDFGETLHPEAIGQINLVTANGSYILPNGVIVLVKADYEAYFNGTLVFYPKGEYEKYSQQLQPLACYAR